MIFNLFTKVVFIEHICVKPDSLIAPRSYPRAAIWMHHGHRISTQNNFAGIKNLSILLSILTVSSAQFNSFVKLNSICSNSLLECRDVRKLLCFCAEGDGSLFHIKPCLEHCDFPLPICLMCVLIYKLLWGQTSSQPALSYPLQTLVMLIKQFLLPPTQNTKPGRKQFWGYVLASSNVHKQRYMFMSGTCNSCSKPKNYQARKLH